PALWIKKYGEEQGIKLKIVLRSMERSKKHRMAKWVCMKLYLDHRILIDVPTLFGWGDKKNQISDEIYLKVKEATEFVESLEDIVEVVDGIENPTGIFYHLEKEALSKGKLYKYKKIDGKEVPYVHYKGQTKVASLEELPKGLTKYQPVYIPDDKREVTIFVLDHLQAMKTESGLNDKQNLDRMSEYARVLRDLYGMSPIIVNQLNRNISDTYRRTKTDLLPEDKDFTGSSNMYNDCDVAGILFNPYKYGINDLKGWFVKECVDSEFGINRFRSFHLLKNTYGPDNQIFGYNFIGENGLYKELPKPSDMNNSIYNNVAYPFYTQRLTTVT
ncbi:MAG: hypothetical protein WD512_03465, partial [Candidatus Paceibacterota bacterium]